MLATDEVSQSLVRERDRGPCHSKLSTNLEFHDLTGSSDLLPPERRASPRHERWSRDARRPRISPGTAVVGSALVAMPTQRRRRPSRPPLPAVLSERIRVLDLREAGARSAMEHRAPEAIDEWERHRPRSLPGLATPCA